MKSGEGESLGSMKDDGRDRADPKTLSAGERSESILGEDRRPRRTKGSSVGQVVEAALALKASLRRRCMRSHMPFAWG